MFTDLRIRWRQSTVGRSASVLSRRDQKKIIFVILVQILLGLLDLVGVALIGVLGALAITGVKSGSPIGKVHTILEFFGIQDWTVQNQVSLLGILASVFLIGRTIISIILTRRILYFLSLRGSSITSKLMETLLSRDVEFLKRRSYQEILFSLTYGVTSITMSVLGVAVTIISDVALLIILTIGLVIADPFIAFASAAIFGSLGLGLYKYMHNRAQSLGKIQSEFNVSSSNEILNTLNLFREISLRNKFPYFISKTTELRKGLASSTAELTLMPSVSKYFLETAVVISALGIAAIEFIRLDSVHAIASLSIFMAAGSRIAPAVLRIQQGAVQIKGSLGAATPTLNLIEELSSTGSTSDSLIEDLPESEFVPSVEIKDLNFYYEGATTPALKNINLDIKPGMQVALVGPSGGGKSTLADCILGVLTVNSGFIKISGLSPRRCIRKFPGEMAYVPQNIFLTSGSIKANVSLSEEATSDDEINIWKVLDDSQISSFVKSLPNGINSTIGENGSNLSGGQKQRLGIARALYSKPKLLVLDEATSAMDGQTEFDISREISRLKGKMTVIMIAHRLSTVQEADLVIYLSNGEIVSSGSFEEVKAEVPDFEEQARLLGL